MKSRIFMIAGILAGICNFVFYLWWQANAPYCCTHICGQTSNMSDCWGNLLVTVFAIIAIMLIGCSALYNLRGE